MDDHIEPTYRVRVKIDARALGVCTLLLAVVAGSCVFGGGSRRSRPLETGRTGAALASITVLNDTDQPLVIAFRPAATPGGEIVVGRVAAQAEAALAPVPAGEPIILLARTPARHELILQPRTFEIAAEWVWHIPTDATFRAQENDES